MTETRVLGLPLSATASPHDTESEARKAAARYRRQGWPDVSYKQRADGRWWVLAQVIPASDLEGSS